MAAKKTYKMKNKLKAAQWGIKLAWKIDKKMFLFWTVLSVGLAVLPAVALHYNRSIIANLSAFLSSGTGTFASVMPDIVMLGLILTISGLSARLNDDLLYMMMYDSYYLGLEEVMMDSAQRIDLTEMVKKDVRDDYFSAISRCGSLTDLTSSGCALLAKLASIVSLLAVAFSASKFIFVMAAVYIVVVIFLNSAFSGKVRTVWKELREMLRRADYFEKLTQTGDTAKETRIFGSAEQIKADWEKAYRQIEQSEVRRTFGIAQLTFLSKAGFYLFMVLMIVYSLFQVAGGKMGPDVLLMIFTLCLHISEAVSTVPRSYQQLDYGLYGLDIQRRFFENTKAVDPKEEQHKANTALDDEHCFEVNGMTFGYSEAKPILKDLNFKIKYGETVALVGGNGCGKTTLIKVLLGLYRPTSGEVKFMGRPHIDYRKHFMMDKVGVFFQDFYLFHLTLGENVGIGNIKEVGNERMIRSAMEKGGAAKLINKLRQGLGHRLGKQVYKDGAVLSGGEGQRVAVSRTHMSDKDVMIFDEPASMLDPIAEMEQFFHIKQKLGGRTSILVSHRIGFARLADRILVLDGATIVEDGTHDDLMKRSGVYAKLFREQAQWYDNETSGDLRPAAGTGQ
ncbi:ABC transporter ATP-binding protein [Paenibacillus allorhizosphaerae]|uniref:Vitamin B12 import ATP-binding protein BtuD n=1 Tax=Paenibacillus allorhizosphaerae TaxID=2849866 RepID=A0ABN7TL56_9BACL|nr:ABC transporter ATP-binding protein [Paenibacillus allorhizosphaerae]CAG7645073.1 Vitamin B12 import ATP-binding protein BtuD [Paenibacillus allorhizosphaerae]